MPLDVTDPKVTSIPKFSPFEAKIGHFGRFWPGQNLKKYSESQNFLQENDF